MLSFSSLLANGYSANGTVACGEACGFLERNGLAFGKNYGCAVDTAVADRDPFHKGNDSAQQTDMFDGIFAPTSWQRWDGVVRNYEFDQA